MEQAQLDFARAARDDGIRRAVGHAEADAPGWGSIALDYLQAYCLTHAEFPGFFVVTASEREPGFPVPANSRAWGAIFTKAARIGLIADSGRTMQHPRRHASKAIVWTSLIYRP